MLESIEKLRDRYYKPSYKGEPTLEQIAGAIEREVSERYMELPCDCEGVPIHVGDRLELGSTHGCVISLTYSPENEASRIAASQVTLS